MSSLCRFAYSDLNARVSVFKKSDFPMIASILCGWGQPEIAQCLRRKWFWQLHLTWHVCVRFNNAYLNIYFKARVLKKREREIGHITNWLKCLRKETNGAEKGIYSDEDFVFRQCNLTGFDRFFKAPLLGARLRYQDKRSLKWPFSMQMTVLSAARNFHGWDEGQQRCIFAHFTIKWLWSFWKSI